VYIPNIVSNVLTNVNPKRLIFTYTIYMTLSLLLSTVFVASIGAAHRQQPRRFPPVFPLLVVAVSVLPAPAWVAVTELPAVIFGDKFRYSGNT
jgi:hypothetical protein